MRTHGYTGTKTHKIWVQMRRRCRDARATGFQNYGGRGITVCDRWQSFENFLEDMSECPEGMSIERKDTNGNYEPGNCVWATQEEQNNNRRNNVFLEHDGKRLTVRQWAREIGVSHATLHSRIRRGLSVDHILSPVVQDQTPKSRKPKRRFDTYSIGDETKTLRQWALDAGLNYTTVYSRVRRGVTLKEALSS